MASPRLLLALAAPLLGLACSAAAPSGADKFFGAPSGVSGVSSNTNVERYFPLVDGTVYNYATTKEDDDKGMLIARVHRTDATHGELIFPTGKKRFVYSPEGVRIEPTGNFVLAAPLQAGTTFRGQNGGRARIDDVGVVIDVKAGSYRDCLRVVEETSGDRRVRFTTTFCPDVGVVSIYAESGMKFERAELVSAGPPVNINDGTTVVPGPSAPPPLPTPPPALPEPLPPPP